MLASPPTLYPATLQQLLSPTGFLDCTLVSPAAITDMAKEAQSNVWENYLLILSVLVSKQKADRETLLLFSFSLRSEVEYLPSVIKLF